MVANPISQSDERAIHLPVRRNQPSPRPDASARGEEEDAVADSGSSGGSTGGAVSEDIKWQDGGDPGVVTEEGEKPGMRS